MSTTPKKRPLPDQKPDTRPDRNLMRRHLSKLVYPDSCFEIRIIHAKVDYRTGSIVPSSSQFATVGGYYQDPEVALSDLNKVEDISVYVVENPIRKSLYSRFNRDKLCSIGKGEATEDEHIDWLMKILIDLDSIRDTGISATDTELRPVLDRQDYLLGHEPEIRAASIWGCSGNGGWITAECKPISCINPDPDDTTWVHPSYLVKHFLTSLSLRYSTKSTEIDCKVFNPARIGPLAGTYKCKGTHSDERQWRPVSLDSPERPVVAFDLEAYCVANPLPEVVPNGRPRARKKGRVGATGLVDTNGAPLSPPVPPSGEPEAAADPDMVMPDGTEDYDDNRIRRAWAYGATKEISIQGQDGSGKLRSICHDILWGFGLTQSEARLIIDVWNRKCLGPWSWDEIQHAFDRAEETGDDEGRPRGYRLSERNGQPAMVVGEFTLNGEAHPDGIPSLTTQKAAKPSPVILWSHREMEANDKVVANLHRFDGLYQKDNMLVEVVNSDICRSKIKFLKMANGSPIIAAASVHRVREIISSIITFTERRSNQLVAQVVSPPEKCVLAVHARHGWHGVPSLLGVVEHPVIRPDGSITAIPGYDSDTGMIWTGTSIDPIPENPTLDDARRSAEILLDIVSDFEFENNISECVWLSSLMTIVGRHLIHDKVPLFLFNASTSGAGKSLLCDVVSCIATGRQMTRTAYHHDAVEMDKRLVAIFLAGTRVTMLDNIDGEFGNAALDNALTARYYSGRLLGHSKMSPPLLVDTVFVATANNAIFCGDVFRRLCVCRLVSSYERPDQQRTGFKIQELEKYVIANRPALIAHVLTIWRAYIQAGCPCNIRAYDYVEWTKMVRGMMMWVIGIDPWGNREESTQSDTRRSGNAAIIEGIAEMLVVLQQDQLTTSEIVRALQSPDSQRLYPLMYGAVMETWNCRNGQIPTPHAIGKRLGQMHETAYGNRRISGQKNTHTKLMDWYLQEYNADLKTWFDLGYRAHDKNP